MPLVDLKIQYARIKPAIPERYAQIVRLFAERGSGGLTVHNVAEALGTFPSNISGRLTELRVAGTLDYLRGADGEKLKRRGACVLVLREQSPGE